MIQDSLTPVSERLTCDEIARRENGDISTPLPKLGRRSIAITKQLTTPQRPIPPLQHPQRRRSTSPISTSPTNKFSKRTPVVPNLHSLHQCLSQTSSHSSTHTSPSSPNSKAPTTHPAASVWTPFAFRCDYIAAIFSAAYISSAG